MELSTLFWFVAGLVSLVTGAEWLVKGASRLATAYGISPLVVGLTVVAYGTSAPELAVCVKAAWAGQADVALGNVVGSNVFNVLFILGLSAVVAPLVVSSRVIRLDVPIMVGLSVLTLALAADRVIGRAEGAVLVGCAIAYTVVQVFGSRRESAAIREEYAQEYGRGRSRTKLNVASIAAGLALLVVGSRWLVDGAVSFAAALGVSELVIGLTIVAAGTSLPEVATSVVAAYRGERDIAVGNVVGSNIMNLAAVLGLSSLVGPDGLAVRPALLYFDLPIMVAVALACLPIFTTGAEIARWEGGLFLFYSGAYTSYVVLAAQQHDALPAFSAVMGVFVLPLTLVTAGVVWWRSARSRSAPQDGEG